MEDPAYVAKLKTRWNELRGSALSDGAVQDKIDAYATALNQSGAVDENFKIWPVLGFYVWVKIDKGELVSYSVAGYEFIHQKGSPGWRNADTEMFPIIGPTNDANFKVMTPKGAAIQDQHGLLRELTYEGIHQTETKAVFEKKYLANTAIENSKFPAKSTEEKLAWYY